MRGFRYGGRQLVAAVVGPGSLRSSKWRVLNAAVAGAGGE